MINVYLLIVILSSPIVSALSDLPKYSSLHGLDNIDHSSEIPKLKDAYEELRTFGGSSGDSDNPFMGKRLYNTSIAFTASFLSYNLPPRTQPGATIDLVNQAIYGLFGFLAAILIYSVPVLITGIMHKDTSRRKRSDDEEEEDNSSWISSPIMKIDNVRRIFDKEYKEEIGLDSTKCLHKTICEAHRSPKNKKYGLLAIPFQIFYPPPEAGATESRATSNQIAAKDGKFTKKDCAKEYRCFFDTLDLAAFLIDWYRLSNDSEYVPSDSDFE